MQFLITLHVTKHHMPGTGLKTAGKFCIKLKVRGCSSTVSSTFPGVALILLRFLAPITYFRMVRSMRQSDATEVGSHRNVQQI